MSEKPNLNYVYELSGGDPAFQEKLLRIIREELPLEIEAYEKNLENGNFILAAENVHKLKPKFGITGLEAGYELAIEYEEELKTGSTRLKDDFKDLLIVVSDFINNL